MTFGEIKTYLQNTLRAQFASPQKGPWATQDLIDNVDAGHQKMFTRVANQAEGFFETFDDLNEVAGVKTIDLPAQLHKLVRLERIKSGSTVLDIPIPLDRIQRDRSSITAYRSANRATSLSVIQGFYMLGQKQIVLEPAPGAASTGGLRCHYVFRPAKMTADAHEPFQKTAGAGGSGKDNLAEFHEIIALYALESMLMKMRDQERASFFMQRRMEREGELTAYLRGINMQEPRYARFTGEADQDWWW